MKPQKNYLLRGRYLGATCVVASLSVCLFYASRALGSIRRSEPTASATERHEPCSDTANVTIDSLLKSIREGDMEAFKRQLKSADVNWKDDFGNTALMEAAGLGDLPIVHLLLERGADPRFLDQYGNGALSLAIQNSHTEIAALLKQPSLSGD